MNAQTCAIIQRYKRRSARGMDVAYSLFEPGHLFMQRSAERVILAQLRRNGCTSLAGKKILDVGCGTGRWLRDFLNYGASPEDLYGIDLLEERVELARKLSPNINISAGDAACMEFGDESFDIVMQSVVFTSVLELSMKRTMAAEMMRVLRPDGIIVWFDFRYDNPKNPDVRGIGKKEVRVLFPGCSCSFRGAVLLPPVARALARYSPGACHLLESVPLLRTHYAAIIRKLRGAAPRIRGG